MQLRVVKLGGSLLCSSRLRERLESWLAAQPNAASLVVVGGGAIVDSVRDLASLHPYDEEFLHWLCIDLLDVTFRLFAAQVPQWTKVEQSGDLNALVERLEGRADRPTPVLVRVAAFYDAGIEATLPRRLPLSWDTTSDSLAALLAHRIGAEELVLLKSCTIEQPDFAAEQVWERLADSGVVDRAFPAVAAGLRSVRCVRLP